MKKNCLFAAITIALVTGIASSQAATIPLSEDFEDDYDEIGSGQPDQQGEEWKTFTDGDPTPVWSLEDDTTTSGTTDYQVAFSKTGTTYEHVRGDSYLTYSNPDRLSTFTAEFEADAVDSNAFAIAGFGLFADYDSGNAGSSGYAVDFFLYDNPNNGDRTGQVRISSSNGTFSGGDLSSSALSIDSTDAKTYTITADVSISGNTLDLSATVSDGTNSVSTSATDTGRITTGDFSIRTRYGSSTEGSLNLDFDNVTLTEIPEPTSLALLLLGGAALLARRRRK